MHKRTTERNHFYELLINFVANASHMHARESGMHTTHTKAKICRAHKHTQAKIYSAHNKTQKINKVDQLLINIVEFQVDSKLINS